MEPDKAQEYANLRRDLGIHPTGLHDDAKHQPDLAARAGELAAELRASAKRAKVHLEELRASTSQRVRSDPSSFGLDKATEAAIATAVTCDTAVGAAHQELISAELSSDRGAALNVAFQHRKSMIQVEVQLFLANYFGEITERDMGEAEDSVTKRDGEVKNVRQAESGRRRRLRAVAVEDSAAHPEGAPPTAPSE